MYRVDQKSKPLLTFLAHVYIPYSAAPGTASPFLLSLSYSFTHFNCSI